MLLTNRIFNTDVYFQNISQVEVHQSVSTQLPAADDSVWLCGLLWNIQKLNLLKISFKTVNHEILKFIARCNFWTFSLIYIEVNSFGIKISHRIHFWYQMSPKMLIFWKNHQKITLFASQFFWQANKKQFWVKNAQITWKSCKDTCLGTIFSPNLIFFKFWTKKYQNCDFL